MEQKNRPPLLSVPPSTAPSGKAGVRADLPALTLGMLATMAARIARTHRMSLLAAIAYSDAQPRAIDEAA